MNKKYELTEKTTTAADGTILHQIRALVDVSDDVPAGKLGGYIENEKNLSSSGEAWVYGDAQVSGEARVFGPYSFLAIQNIGG